MTELKPCPFCGRSNLETAEVFDPGYMSVSCLDCHSDGPKVYDEDLPEKDKDNLVELAEAAWNERRHDQTPRATTYLDARTDAVGPSSGPAIAGRSRRIR